MSNSDESSKTAGATNEASKLYAKLILTTIMYSWRQALHRYSRYSL